MPATLFTAKDQLVWSQRIQKEAINAKAQGKFSVRGAVSTLDVPKEFKPGHVDPSTLTKSTSFDPAKVGWDPQSTAAKEFRRCLNMQTAGPRERHQFPETMAQEHGWAQARSGPAQDRSEPAGSVPVKLGIGWLQNDGHGMLMKAANAAPKSGAASSSGSRSDGGAAKQQQPPQKQQFPRRPKNGDVRGMFGAAPFATSTPTARFPVASGSTGSPSGKAAAAEVLRSASAPALAATATLSREEEFMQQEEALIGAMKHSTTFLNRHSKQWYRPLSNSDVATFADCYTKSWGKQLYGKTK